MIDAWIATGFLVVLTFVSSVFYLDNITSLKRFKSAKRIKSLPSFRFVYLFIMLTTLTLAPLCFFYNSHYLFEWHNSIAVLYIGLSIATLGMTLFVISKVNLGENYNPCFEAFVPKDIIRDGVYKYIRHPIYTANIIVLIGAFVATGSWWLLPNVLLLTYSYCVASQNEEMALTHEFPEYLNYVRKTGAFLPKLPLPEVNKSPDLPSVEKTEKVEVEEQV